MFVLEIGQDDKAMDLSMPVSYLLCLGCDVDAKCFVRLMMLAIEYIFQSNLVVCRFCRFESRRDETSRSVSSDQANDNTL